MSEIKVSVVSLEDQIQKLSALQKKCEGISVKPKKAEGAGTTNTALQALDKEYTELKAAMVELIGNSVEFFTNVKNSMDEADQKSAEQFEKEVGAK